MKSSRVNAEYDVFSNHGAIAVLFCSMVGIGNICSFPYVIGSNGGGAFIIVYSAILLALGIPYIVCALSIGSHTKSCMLNSYSQLSANRFWCRAGWFSILACVFIMPSYSQLGGTLISYLFKFMRGDFYNASTVQVESIFKDVLNSPLELLVWQNVFIVLSSAVISFDLKNVWERICSICMPIMLLCIGILLAYSYNLYDFKAAASFMLIPRWKMLSAESFNLALDFAVYSLNLGLGILISIGIHIRDSRRIFKIASLSILLDTMVSILIGIIIFSLVLSSGSNMGGGPGLIFMEVVKSFLYFDKSGMWAFLFFLLVNTAILTSSAALIESLSLSAMDILQVARPKATALVCIFMCLFSNVYSLFLPMLRLNNRMSFIASEMLSFLSEGFFIFTSTFLLIVFAGWCIDHSIMKKELGSIQMKKKYMPLFTFTLKFISPLMMFTSLMIKLGLIHL